MGLQALEQGPKPLSIAFTDSVYVLLVYVQDVKTFLDLEWLDVPPSWKFLDTQLITFAVHDYLPGLPGFDREAMTLPFDRGTEGGNTDTTLS